MLVDDVVVGRLQIGEEVEDAVLRSPPWEFCREALRGFCRARPSTPSGMKRSCQREMQVLALSVAAVIAFVPTSSALRSTICQTKRDRG
jgi:hypothetical protein